MCTMSCQFTQVSIYFFVRDVAEFVPLSIHCSCRYASIHCYLGQQSGGWNKIQNRHYIPLEDRREFCRISGAASASMPALLLSSLSRSPIPSKAIGGVRNEHSIGTLWVAFDMIAFFVKSGKEGM